MKHRMRLLSDYLSLCPGTAETNQIYETSKLDKDVPTLGIRNRIAIAIIPSFADLQMKLIENLKTNKPY